MSRKERIDQNLSQALAPVFLQVEDESSNHHVPKGAETHFKVTAVSAKFLSLTRVARHRLVNEILGEEFKLGLHALSMHLYTAEEWEKQKNVVLKSPVCKDGFDRS